MKWIIKRSCFLHWVEKCSLGLRNNLTYSTQNSTIQNQQGRQLTLIKEDRMAWNWFDLPFSFRIGIQSEKKTLVEWHEFHYRKWIHNPLWKRLTWKIKISTSSGLKETDSCFPFETVECAWEESSQTAKTKSSLVGYPCCTQKIERYLCPLGKLTNFTTNDIFRGGECSWHQYSSNRFIYDDHKNTDCGRLDERSTMNWQIIKYLACGMCTFNCALISDIA